MAISDTRHFPWNYQSFSNLIGACFLQKIKVLMHYYEISSFLGIGEKSELLQILQLDIKK